MNIVTSDYLIVDIKNNIVGSRNPIPDIKNYYFN